MTAIRFQDPDFPQHRTHPDPKQTGWPKGIGYIVWNEGCERFSFYGMRAILWLYVVMLYKQSGLEHHVAEHYATSTTHLFNAGVYALPMIGALIADRLLGKYPTIFWLSIVYCFGHFVLSLTEGKVWGLYAGLSLIAIGSGGIKPCVSANVGDQFGAGNKHLLEKVYQLFYFMINFGSFFSTLLTPLLREWFGWRVAFAVPGVLMFVASVLFWMGRHKYVRVPPSPGGKLGALDVLSGTLLFGTFGSLFFTSSLPTWAILTTSTACFIAGLVVFEIRQKIQPDDGFLAMLLFSMRAAWRGDNARAVTRVKNLTVPKFFAAAEERYGAETAEGPVAVIKIISIFFLVSVFWALFDQSTSSWVQQATRMDLQFNLFGHAFRTTPDQMQAINPILVMLLIPLMSFGVYPFLEKVGLKMTPLRRMTLGMFVATLAFASVALIQQKVDNAAAANAPPVHIAWQIIPYIIMTIAEVMVSITGLEFAYTQAPKRMKSIIMGFWLLTVAFGNVLVAVLARFSSLSLLNFFWLFTGFMGAAALLFGVRAYFYQPKEYLN